MGNYIYKVIHVQTNKQNTLLSRTTGTEKQERELLETLPVFSSCETLLAGSIAVKNATSHLLTEQYHFWITISFCFMHRSSLIQVQWKANGWPLSLLHRLPDLMEHVREFSGSPAQNSRNKFGSAAFVNCWEA